MKTAEATAKTDAAVRTEGYIGTLHGLGKVDISLDPAWFAEDSLQYNHELGRLSALITMTGYDMCEPAEGQPETRGIRRILLSLGMTEVECYPVSQRDEVNYVFARKPMTVNGEQTDLIVVSLIGSRFEQWYTNFDSGTGDTHKGFAAAAEFIYARLSRFLEKTGADNMKFLISGHSRGAATANLLSARLIKEEKFAAKENIFTYTFATPSVTLPEERKNAEFKRIFNIVNEEDFVTRCMPSEWGYGRYGVSLALPNKRNNEQFPKILEEMNELFAVYQPETKYIPFKEGPETLDELMKTLSASVKNVFEYYHTTFRCLGKQMSVFEFFRDTLCGITAEPPGTRKNNASTVLMMMTSVRRLECHPVLRAVADFFIFYEGLAGATNNAVSETYFSYSHSIHAYCAFMVSQREDKLVPTDK